ncbi:response regulator [bacterium]|nr:response regulator [bacterium]
MQAELARLRVLVVEDNPDDLHVISRYLRLVSEDVEISALEQGRDAIHSLTGDPARFDCIFLDYLLPDMSGMDVLAALAGLGDALPSVVMLTGQGDELVSARALRSGAFDYIPKNALDRQLLQDTIRRVLDYRDMRHAIERERRLREEAELALRERELDRARLEAIRAAVATSMHEISNPLTGIIGMLQIQLDEEPDNEDVRMMLAAALRIRELTVRLNNLERVSYSRVHLAASEGQELSDDAGPAGRMQGGSLMLDI